MGKPRITRHNNRATSANRGIWVGADTEMLAFHALVDDFALEIKAKWQASREKGRSGWDAEDWSERCKAMLHEHVDKGDARDIGVLAAFLFNMREEETP